MYQDSKLNEKKFLRDIIPKQKKSLKFYGNYLKKNRHAFTGCAVGTLAGAATGIPGASTAASLAGWVIGAKHDAKREAKKKLNWGKKK